MIVSDIIGELIANKEVSRERVALALGYTYRSGLNNALARNSIVLSRFVALCDMCGYDVVAIKKDRNAGMIPGVYLVENTVAKDGILRHSEKFKNRKKGNVSGVSDAVDDVCTEGGTE